jgi:ABC-type glycerol-3-phosphate transport system permease component
MPRDKPSLLAACSSHTFLLAFGATMMLPFLWMLSTSLKSDAEVFDRTALPMSTTLGSEGTALVTVGGRPLHAATQAADGTWTRGEPLRVRLGSPIQEGSKGDRARAINGENLSDDIGQPVQLGNLLLEQQRLQDWGGVARFRDSRVFAKYAEPVTVDADFAAPGFDAAANEAAAQRWFCVQPGRYADGWHRLKHSRFGGRVPLMMTTRLYEDWAPRSGKAEPLAIGGIPVPNRHPRPITGFYQFKNVSWGGPGEPVRDLTLPAVLCQADGTAVPYQPAFPILRTADDPLKADDRNDLLAFVGDETKPRTVLGSELQLKRQVRLVWSNYQTVLTDPNVKMSLFAWNSLFIAICVTALQVLTCSLAAFAFSRIEWPGRDTVFLLYLGTLMVPGAVTMIPNYLILQHLGWLNSFFGLIIPASASAYGTFMLRQYMLTLPKGLEEAARIDGAGLLRVWWDIVLPLCKPALITLAIFTFSSAWGSFSWPLIIAPDESVRVLPVALQNFSNTQNTAFTLLMAASLIMMLPMLILFIFGQKYFVKGIQLGGVKG